MAMSCSRTLLATGGVQIRKLFAEKAPVALVGCPTAMVGRELVRAGFHAAYVSGYVTALNAGMPDIGLIPREDMCRRIRELQAATNVPVIADADTGFGELEAMYMTVHEYARAGAAGFHIEDQVFPKRCGHLEGKQVVPAEDFIKKIEAASAARATCSDPDFVIIARSDAKSVEGFDSMKARLRAYV
jgi:methylisocitrate lyase